MNPSHSYRSTEPDEHNPIPNPPMLYVSESLVWEYKRLSHSLKNAPPPTEADLDDYGKEGWELVSSLIYADNIYFYFKRLAK